MNYYEVGLNVIARSEHEFFTYASAEVLALGQVVTVSIGKKTATGVVLRNAQKPTYETKEIIGKVEGALLPDSLVRTGLWIADYYATHLATVLQTLLPRGITKQRRERKITEFTSVRKRTHFLLNNAQSAAVSAVENMGPGSAILHGITGSGKTAVYLELARRALERGESALVLVPEIALTSQLVDEFRAYFPNVYVTHSRQTEAERHVTWEQIAVSTEPVIAIGPRSALFLPIKNLKLILVDEAHEPSYKQEQSPRYSALRVAGMLAQFTGGKTVYGSATPLVSEYYLAEQAGRPIITLPERAVPGVLEPTIEIVDMTAKAARAHHAIFSKPALKSLDEALDAGHQVLVFHNRRGSASTTLCENCGWSATCARCYIPMTLHSDRHELRCHVCDARERVPTSCPECGEAEIIHKGLGTKRIEAELSKLYPKKTIARFDGDTNDADTVDKRYNDLYNAKIDIIVGTQVIAKGLDLPHLRLVIVPQADAGLSLPDFATAERTFQLLAQAIGRVGRTEHPTRVVVQSFQPNHPAVTHGIAQDYQRFYQVALDERHRGHFPPFTYLLKLTCVYKTEATAIKNSRTLAAELRAKFGSEAKILGPTPSFYERQRDTYRWQVVVRAPKRATLQQIVIELPKQGWQYELDPLSLL